MLTLTIDKIAVKSFHIPFVKPFTFAGNTIYERKGYYIELTTENGLTAVGEIAPLVGVSPETDRRAKHDIDEALKFLPKYSFPSDKEDLFKQLRQELHLINSCASVRFGIESALCLLAAEARNQDLCAFLGGAFKEMPSAVLLQGAHQQVMDDAKKAYEEGKRVFKLKVGDRNIALDVKKLQDLRIAVTEESLIRLDANRVWGFKEAGIFAELAGNEGIEFIEEPLSDPSRLVEFYQLYHMPIALDETLSVLRLGVNAPGRCMPTLAHHEAVKAYVIKPMILGFINAVDWIEEACRGGKKAIISSAFESPVALGVLSQLAALTGQPSGLGTERWLKTK